MMAYTIVSRHYNLNNPESFKNFPLSNANNPHINEGDHLPILYCLIMVLIHCLLYPIIFDHHGSGYTRVAPLPIDAHLQTARVHPMIYGHTMVIT